jgi:hypothetical protein
MANPLGAMMAEGEGFQRKVILAFYTILLVAGVVLYWVWGLIYDTWSPFTRGNIGIYTIYILLICFGVFGLLLNWKKPAGT